MRFERYKQNLRQEGSYIVSYDTKVAEIKGDEIHKLYWKVNGRTSSPTTSRHINYVAGHYKLKIIDII